MRDAYPVYVVDDDPGILDSTQFLLGSLGIHSEIFSEPLAFLERAGTLAPGCVLTDLNMPTMSGIELQDRLRAARFGWPVILMSARPNGESIHDLLGGGLRDFLEKPFTASQLLDSLNRAFDELQAQLIQHVTEIRMSARPAEG